MAAADGPVRSPPGKRKSRGRRHPGVYRALETIRDGESGLLFPTQSTDALAQAMLKATHRSLKPQRLIASAAQFDVAIFRRRIENFISEHLATYVQPKAT